MAHDFFRNFRSKTHISLTGHDQVMLVLEENILKYFAYKVTITSSEEEVLPYISLDGSTKSNGILVEAQLPKEIATTLAAGETGNSEPAKEVLQKGRCFYHKNLWEHAMQDKMTKACETLLKDYNPEKNLEMMKDEPAG